MKKDIVFILTATVIILGMIYLQFFYNQFGEPFTPPDTPYTTESIESFMENHTVGYSTRINNHIEMINIITIDDIYDIQKIPGDWMNYNLSLMVMPLPKYRLLGLMNLGGTPTHMCLGNHGTWTSTDGQNWDYATWYKKTEWSRNYICENYHCPCLSFAYPFGVYTNTSWLALYDTGHRIAFIIDTGQKNLVSRPPDTPWEFLTIPRYTIKQGEFNRIHFMEIQQDKGLFVGYIHPWETIDPEYLQLLEEYNILTMTSDQYYQWSTTQQKKETQ